MIEVRRFGRSRARVIMIDGEPHFVREAAAKLGLTVSALKKRLDRGYPLDVPPQPRGFYRPNEERTWSDG